MSGRASPVASPVRRLLAVDFTVCILLLINYGHDFSSMIMAGLWVLALGCYLTGVFAAARAVAVAGGQS